MAHAVYASLNAPICPAIFSIQYSVQPYTIRTGQILKSTRMPAAAAAVAAAVAREGLNGPDPVLMKKQAGLVARLMDYLAP